MSTVLDVTVCLLLVGVAVATLAAAPAANESPEVPDATPAAATVASVTATVEAGEGRRSHGTLAGHLGTAAVADVRLDGEPVVDSEYSPAVAGEVESLTRERVSVTARWEPYPDAPLASNVTAGSDPPSSADVGTRTLTVDSGVDSPRRTDSIEELARSLADAYVTWLFPPERTYARLGDPRTAPSTTGRYGAAGERLGVDVTSTVADGNVRAANDELSDALATSLEVDLQKRYGTHEAAVESVSVDEVEIVVRRWEQ